MFPKLVKNIFQPFTPYITSQSNSDLILLLSATSPFINKIVIDPKSILVSRWPDWWKETNQPTANPIKVQEHHLKLFNFSYNTIQMLMWFIVATTILPTYNHPIYVIGDLLRKVHRYIKFFTRSWETIKFSIRKACYINYIELTSLKHVYNNS